jgi:hypothetical protein
VIELDPNPICQMPAPFAAQSVVNPLGAGVHAPSNRANAAAALVAPPIQLGNDEVVRGAFAELVRSKVAPSHVTKKLVNVGVAASYVKDPAVGTIPDPVKLIV